MPLLFVQLVQLDLVRVLNLLQPNSKELRHLSQVLVLFLGSNCDLALRVTISLGVLRRLFDDILLRPISSSLGSSDQLL